MSPLVLVRLRDVEQLFDTVTGLPVHPLVVHAVVVLGPLAALLAVAYVVVPRWRVGLRWPLVLLAIIAAGSAFVAEQSGEALEERLESIGAAPASLGDHVDAGELATKSLLALLVVVLITVFGLARARSEGKGRATIALVLTLAAGGLVGFATVQAGHTGATAVWSDLIANTDAGGDDSDE